MNRIYHSTQHIANKVFSTEQCIMEYGNTHQQADALLTQIREGHRLMRITAAIVLCCFAVVFYSPAVNATIKAVDDYLAYQPDYPVFAEMDAALQETQKLVKQLSVANGKNQQPLKQRIDAQYKAFVELDDAANAYFNQQLAYNQQQQLSPKTISALEQRQSLYQQDMATLQEQLQRISRAQGEELQKEVRLTSGLLDRLYRPPSHHPYDQDMPFGPLDAAVDDPIDNSVALQSHLGVAELGGEPIASDLEATVDAQLSPAIVQQAAALNNDPVAIYNWVYSNIEFIPSYGSLQGADYTLQTLRGNAFDQSSLLIALLRACLLYTSPSPRDQRGSRMPSSA